MLPVWFRCPQVAASGLALCLGTRLLSGSANVVGVSRRRNERLVNLVICLLSSRNFLTASQIARTVPGYEHDETNPKEHTAFQRMFERDKAELRELGVPVEVGTTSIFDTEAGYRITQRDYSLPEIELTPAQAAAVGLAARLWQNANLSSAAASGLRKLHAAGALPQSETQELGLHGALELAPVGRPEPALEPLLSAGRTRQTVRFTYQRPVHADAPADAGEPTVRELQPWGTVAWRGRWYVVGYDNLRQAPRCFRLSRIIGDVEPVGEPGAFTPPTEVDLMSHVMRSAPAEHSRKARIRVRREAAAGLRRWAEAVEPDTDTENSATPEGEVLTLPFWRVDWLAARLTSYGDVVTVLDPPELREAVVARLRMLAGLDSAAERGTDSNAGTGFNGGTDFNGGTSSKSGAPTGVMAVPGATVPGAASARGRA